MASKILEFIVVVSSVGFAPAIMRFVSFYLGNRDYARAKGTILYSAGIMFLISFFLAVALFLLSDVIAVKLFDRTDLPPLLKILILALPFTVTGSAFLSAIIGLKLIKQHVAITNIMGPLFYLAILSFAFLLG